METTTYDTLEVHAEGGVATVWMNRPKVHNAFNEQLIAELTDAFVKLSVDPLSRVIVLAGRGKSFSAGADLSWMQRAAGYGLEQNLEDARALAAMLHTIASCPKPTVARVHGAALGGGTGLTAACDIAVAATAASFATTEVRFGIIPSAISPYVLRAIGPRQASRWFLAAERFDAEAACRAGLVHEVVAAEALDARVAAIAKALLEGGPQAQTAAKDLIRAISHRAITVDLREETAQRIAHLRAGAEAKEGVGAFLAKRKASWIARD